MKATGFQTMGDPVLEKMITQAASFWRDVRVGAAPRWLSLCGPSGTGKTFLAKKLRTFASKLARLHCQFDTTIGPRARGISYEARWFSWPEVADGFPRGDYSALKDLRSEWFVVIDEIGSARERMEELELDQLFRVLNQRNDKWTVITSNQTVEQLSEREARIADRLVRDRNVTVTLPLNTPSFAIR